MIRRLVALAGAAFVAISLAGAPGARADDRLAVQNPRILCISFVVDGYCVENPIRRLP